MTRTIYSNSNVEINGSGLLVQSFNLNKNMNHEIIEEYGNINFYQVVGEPLTANCDITCYPELGTFGNLIQQLTSHTISNDPQRETIRSNLGGLDYALLTSFKISANLGSVPLATLNFNGAISAGAPLALSSSSSPISTVLTTESISINSGDICAQNIDFNWAVPVTNIPKYEENLNYPTGFFGDPVGTATVSLQGITSFLSNVESISFGVISMNFEDIKVISSGVNLTVGTVGATFNLNFQCSANNVSFN